MDGRLFGNFVTDQGGYFNTVVGYGDHKVGGHTNLPTTEFHGAWFHDVLAYAVNLEFAYEFYLLVA